MFSDVLEHLDIFHHHKHLDKDHLHYVEIMLNQHFADCNFKVGYHGPYREYLRQHTKEVPLLIKANVFISSPTPMTAEMRAQHLQDAFNGLLVKKDITVTLLTDRDCEGFWTSEHIDTTTNKRITVNFKFETWEDDVGDIHIFTQAKTCSLEGSEVFNAAKRAGAKWALDVEKPVDNIEPKKDKASSVNTIPLEPSTEIPKDKGCSNCACREDGPESDQKAPDENVTE